MLATARRWAVIHELRGAPEPSLDELLARMTPVDLVLVEGFKRFPHPKLEVHRRERGTPLLAREDPSDHRARHRRAAAASCPAPVRARRHPGDRRLRPRPPRHRGPAREPARRRLLRLSAATASPVARGPGSAARADRARGRARSRWRSPRPRAACSPQPLVSAARRAGLRQCRRRRLRLRLRPRHAARRARAWRLRRRPRRGRPSLRGRAAAGRRRARPDRRARCRAAPTPSRCRRRSRLADGTRRRSPPASERGANRRRAGEDVAAGARCSQPGTRAPPAGDRRSPPSSGCAALPVFAPLAGRAALQRRRAGAARQRPWRRAASSTPTGRSSQALLRALPVEVTRSRRRCPTTPARCARAPRRAARRPRRGPHLGRRLARRRGPCRPQPCSDSAGSISGRSR